MINSYPKSLAKKPYNVESTLGQVFTPSDIADRMVELLFSKAKSNMAYNILDPAVGPFTFPKAIIERNLLNESSCITAIDIDSSMISLTRSFLSDCDVDHFTTNADYLKYDTKIKFDLAIFNPPYVRQEWIVNKSEYRALFKNKYNVDIPGTSNLYVYFVVKTIMDLRDSGTFVCILYDSWQYTIYGKWLEQFIGQTCRDIEIYPVEHQPFDGRLINATIIKAVRTTNISDHHRVSRIDSQIKSGQRMREGFLPISEVLKPKRGLRLKQASFFLSDDSMIDLGATPFLKKVGKIKGYSVPNQHSEYALLVWDGHINSQVLNVLEQRIQKAKLKPEENTAVLTWYNERPESWFIHPEPPYSSIVFNYYLRNRPRHIYNPERAYSDNFYGLTVSDNDLLFAYISLLNSTTICNSIIDSSRKQGNGLYKIQLFEYKCVKIPDINVLRNRDIKVLNELGKLLVQHPEKSESFIAEIDYLLWSIYHYTELDPDYVKKSLETKIFRE